MGNTSAQRQFLVKVSGIEGFFMTKTGGNVSADTSKIYDGGSDVPDVMAAPAEADNLTVSRGYKRSRDAELLAVLRKRVGKWRTTVSVTPTDEDLVADGRPTVYADALLVGLTEPDTDAAGGEGATYELEFAPGSFV